MADRDPQVVALETDGVPTFWVETPGPQAVTLLVRVGTTDETAPTRGITHLLEHLVLYPMRDRTSPFNGQTSNIWTAFGASGSEDELRAFLDGVCAGLRAVPVDALDVTTRVLAAEANAQAPGPTVRLLDGLYGPRGPGLAAYPEWVEKISEREIQAWSDRYFVRENAVLLLHGPKPVRVGLSLPAGEHCPIKLPEADACGEPGSLVHVGSSSDSIWVGFMGDRSLASQLALQVLWMRLLQQLRHERGLVYYIDQAHTVLDAATAFHVIGTPASAETLNEVAERLLDAVRDFGRSPMRTEEVRKAHEATWGPHTRADPIAFANLELQRRAEGHLLGEAHSSRADLEACSAALTPGQVLEAYEKLLAHSAALAPDHGPLCLRPPPEPPGTPIEGRTFRSRSSKNRLRVGPEGISVYSRDAWRTILWADVALAVTAPPDRWILFDSRGHALEVNIGGWRWKARLQKLLEEHVPKTVLIPQGRRV